MRGWAVLGAGAARAAPPMAGSGIGGMALMRNMAAPGVLLAALLLVACQGRPVPPPPSVSPAPNGSTASGSAETPTVPVRVIPLRDAAPLIRMGSFSDADHGWLQDEKGQILASTDGGLHWARRGTLGQAVRNFSFATPELGWAVVSAEDSGQSSTLRASDDGGRTWQPLPVGDLQPRTVQRLDAATGWMSALEPPRRGEWLYVTTDAGRTWSPLLPASDAARQVRFSFLSRSTGWAIQSDWMGMHTAVKVLSVTYDGGRHWQVVSSVPFTPGKPLPAGSLPLGGHAADLQFLDEEHGWLRTGPDLSRLYATADGGRTWQELSVPGEPWILAQRFFSARSGRVLATMGDDSAWLQTQDGSRTWHRLYPALRPTGAIWQRLDERQGIATGSLSDPGGGLLRTTDGGAAWRPLATLPGVRSLSFISPAEGWALTNDMNYQFHLYHTRDGGATWTALPWVSDVRAFSLQFLDGQTGFLLREGAKLLVTHDGGAEFQPVADVGAVQAVRFTSPTTGWLMMMGNSQMLMRTADGGRTWTPVALPFAASELAAVAGGPVWVLGNHGDVRRWFLARTGDAGHTWTTYDLAPLGEAGFSQPNSLSFADADHGWLVAGGHLFSTDDGGRTWEQKD